ncbi:TetR/AcrR family transcriptional regulator [Actinomadura bangladeshensis]|jgi:AcrR family transcriptional regulator|uniref:TetR/AcrR family transcriptional regulator n=1 Tax=Actinomadura bangladeshensis TaxID=453573 RepID=A0A6L9QEV2_9ACTN|nr:TetR family transcriptional regulator C-terminal domain-containing protein [Actinomadura bangladeshensis]NEA24001.1 TetR/AcrR family transcriptional regulator [Actinomadura bangladeshensis]
MPRTADHDARRAQIIDGLVRVAGRDGLHAVTMRSVAAEAGVSLRLVQYYFESKAQLMNAALERLERQSHERWAARLADLDDPSPREVVEALLAEALPTDPESRAFHLVWTSYAVLAQTDPSLAARPFVDGPDRLERRLARVLADAGAPGDPAVEAARLLALAHGLGTGVLVGGRTPESALGILGHHLDGLFPR